ncbi:MAG: hypothetical protein HZC02_02035 [Candidatus Levybacteria bacterium]|nr:hypothetical protein [Candidatus Levybacteria bacterium]
MVLTPKARDEWTKELFFEHLSGLAKSDRTQYAVKQLVLEAPTVIDAVRDLYALSGWDLVGESGAMVKQLFDCYISSRETHVKDDPEQSVFLVIHSSVDVELCRVGPSTDYRPGTTMDWKLFIGSYLLDADHSMLRFADQEVGISREDCIRLISRRDEDDHFVATLQIREPLL